MMAAWKDSGLVVLQIGGSDRRSTTHCRILLQLYVAYMN
jgi:hypothetical protein